MVDKLQKIYAEEIEKLADDQQSIITHLLIKYNPELDTLSFTLFNQASDEKAFWYILRSSHDEATIRSMIQDLFQTLYESN